MENNILFRGIYPAIFSVYDKNLNVLEESVEKMVNYQLDAGVDGFYVCGATGECITLPAKTRKQMLEAVVKYNNGRGKIIAHIGAGHFDETMELLAHANTLKIDAVASLPPTLTAYYKADEIIDYYRLLAENSKVPVIAYVKPELNQDYVWFAQEIMKIPNVAGVKLTISNYFAFGRVVMVNGGNINVLNGPDETMICGLMCGAHGAIGTTYNFAPKLACKIYNSFMSGDIEGARKHQQMLNKIILVGMGKGIKYWKAIMSTLGFDMGEMVLPGKNVSSEELAKLKEQLTEIGFYEQI